MLSSLVYVCVFFKWLACFHLIYFSVSIPLGQIFELLEVQLIWLSGVWLKHRKRTHGLHDKIRKFLYFWLLSKCIHVLLCTGARFLRKIIKCAIHFNTQEIQHLFWTTCLFGTVNHAMCTSDWIEMTHINITNLTTGC